MSLNEKTDYRSDIYSSCIKSYSIRKKKPYTHVYRPNVVFYF